MRADFCLAKSGKFMVLNLLFCQLALCSTQAEHEPSLQSCHGVADVGPPVIWISYPLVPYFRVWMDPAKAKLAGPYLLQVMESLHGR